MTVNRSTVLAMAQRMASRLQIPIPTTFVNNMDNNMVLLKAMLLEALKTIRDEYEWPELQREHSFTLATGIEAYGLPNDFNSFINNTEWNRTQSRPLYGPTTPPDWQLSKSGLSETVNYQQFRIKGISNTEFYIDPIPSATENGQICIYEYITKTTTLPITWAQGLVFGINTYCFYNGNIYQTTAGGIAGATPPTHITGSASDGAVTWVYISPVTGGYFEQFNLDTDQVVLDYTMIEDSTVWRFKRERRLDYQELMIEAENKKEIKKVALKNCSSVDARAKAQPSSPHMLDYSNYPEGNY